MVLIIMISQNTRKIPAVYFIEIKKKSLKPSFRL